VEIKDRMDVRLERKDRMVRLDIKDRMDVRLPGLEGW